MTDEQREAIEWAAGRAHVESLGKPITGAEARRWRVLSDLFRAASACQTCNGNGVIGGPSYYAPDEGGEPCPDCAQPSQAQAGEAVKEWIEETCAAYCIPRPFALVERLSTTPPASPVASHNEREAVLRDALAAISAEHLADSTGLADDVAYDQAVTDCENAIRALLAARNGGDHE